MTNLLTSLRVLPGGETLLLVAVSGKISAEGDYPCRVVGAISPVEAAGTDTEGEISRYLTEIGVPANLLGHAYLHAALAHLLRDASLRRGMGRTLYPLIAREYGAAPASVERAIRHAIAVAFSRGGGARYRQLLGRLSSCVGDRPTNAEFLSQSAEFLRRKCPEAFAASEGFVNSASASSNLAQNMV